MKPRSKMLLEVTVYCGKVRDQRGCLIGETSPAPGIHGPAAAKTRQSINIFAWQGRDLRSACLKRIVCGLNNEPPEEFSLESEAAYAAGCPSPGMR